MIRSCLVVAAVIQVSLGQNSAPIAPTGPNDGFTPNVPKHCLTPPPGTDLYKCCPIPKLFSDEELQRCGIEVFSVDQPRRPPKPRVPCKESICLMQNADMLQANHSVDYVKFRSFVDKWGSAHPEFTDAIQEARKICARDGGPTGPPVCEHDRVFYCLNSLILWNCKLRELDGCQVLKAHMDECRPYFLRQREQEEAARNAKSS